jgi:hypothetical protein
MQAGKFLHGSKPLKNRYIVTLTPTDPTLVAGLANSLIHEFQGRNLGVMTHGISAFGVEMTEQHARALSHHPLVAQVEEDESMELSDKAQFDFVKSRPQTGTGEVHEQILPFHPRADSTAGCPWQGSYFLCTYSDDTYWHLDRLDNQGLLTSTPKYYAFASTGSNVRAYILDFGIYGGHQEFDSPSRVETGANMVIDPDATNTVTPPSSEEQPVDFDSTPANFPCGAWQTGDVNANPGHGTGVASVLGGTNSGVAKNVTLVPVKVITCTGHQSKLSMARGLDWVIGDMAAHSNKRGVVSISTFIQLNAGAAGYANSAQTCEDGHGGYTNCVSAFENEINNTIAANIPVVVSANNQGTDECALQSPARMGYGNEANFNSTYRTITVGGTMAFSNDGYADHRWTCADSPQPQGCNDGGWGAGNPGSNYGACVSIWAPAWNLHVAGASSSTSYRDPYGPSSGTSWSAPYVAGVIARLFETYPTMSATQVFTELINRSNNRWIAPDFDPSAVTNNHLVYMSPYE